MWQHFSNIVCAATNVQVKGFIACNDCRKVFKNSSSGGTSNALAHMKKHKQPKQTIDKYIAPVKSAVLTLSERDGLAEASINFVCKDLRPYAALEGEGFLDFAHTIWNLGAKHGAATRDHISSILPSAVTLSRNVKKMAITKKEKMRSILSQVLNCCLFIGITCDIWMDDYRKISYMALTAHFYTESIKLCDQVISIVPMDVTIHKDSTYVKDCIKKALESNCIPFDHHKLVFITDRGSNIKKALQNFTRLNCFPHFVNNMVQQACKIDTISKMINQCAKLVKYFKISGLNNEFEISLKSVIKTRFNYVHATIESILFNWVQIQQILERENELSRIDGMDIDLLKRISSFLLPFKHWSDHCEKSKSPSLSYVWIAIDSIIKHCAVGDDEEHLISIMKVKVLSYIEKRFVLDKLHWISTFLNPNFKCLKFASPLLYDKTLNETRELLTTVPSEVVPNVSRRISLSSTSTIESELSNYCDFSEDEDEISAYVRHTHFVDLKIDLGVWWFERRNDFPRLSKIALAIHALPASSTPSERAFSTSGAIITERRVGLSPSSIEDIIILRSDSQKFEKHNIWQ